MPRKIAIFDTNIYRGLGVARATELAQRQRAASVISFANIWTIAELSAHLADPTDPDFARCRGALEALWRHCSLYDGFQQYLPIIADSEDQICKSLFGKNIPGRQAEANAAGWLVRHVANSRSADELQEVLPVLSSLRDHCARVEAEFVEGMRNVVKELDPKAAGWETFREDRERRRALLARIDAGEGLPHLAEALVKKAADSLELTLDDESLRGRTEFLLKNFRTPLMFYDAIVRKLVDGGIDMSKPNRSNSIWDLQIAFYGIPGSTVDGIPLVLVTEERAIREAAAKAGNSSAALALQEFITSVS